MYAQRMNVLSTISALMPPVTAESPREEWSCGSCVYFLLMRLVIRAKCDHRLEGLISAKPAHPLAKIRAKDDPVSGSDDGSA